MIKIRPSPNADTRTCDFSKVTKPVLLTSSLMHIGDIHAGMEFFADQIAQAANRHDHDKVTDLDGFHRDFLTGFKETTWWDNHRKVNRHHLTQEDGIPADVNLVDVIDFIVDCVMAGMARSGSVYPLALPPELLARAFANTVELLKAQVVVETPLQGARIVTREERWQAIEDAARALVHRWYNHKFGVEQAVVPAMDALRSALSAPSPAPLTLDWSDAPAPSEEPCPECKGDWHLGRNPFGVLIGCQKCNATGRSPSATPAGGAK